VTPSRANQGVESLLAEQFHQLAINTPDRLPGHKTQYAQPPESHVVSAKRLTDKTAGPTRQTYTDVTI